MTSRSPPILIRTATLDDAKAMTTYMAALSAEAPGTVTRRAPPTENEERAFISAAGAAGATIFLALEGERVVGLLDVWPGDAAHVRHVWHFGMSVASAYRRQGIGRRLAAEAVDHCRSQATASRLELEVVPWNAPAIALYLSLGFVVEATKAKAINLRGKPEDLLLMAMVW
jgi:ribosomal protein S18 acetylase RimI-like enzyme